MTPRLSELKWRLIGLLGKGIVTAIFATSRIDTDGYDDPAAVLRSGNIIGAIWHSRILIFSYLFQGWGGAILVSASDDGEIIARILERQGHEPIRGSTTRGGLRAMAALIKRVKNGRHACITPDGPQGPRFQVQPGIITLAKKTGAPIIPMTYSARHAKILPSWDRFMLPRPFTRCRVIYGEPIRVPTDATPVEQECLRIRLERILRDITDRADADFGRHVPGVS